MTRTPPGVVFHGDDASRGLRTTFSLTPLPLAGRR